MAGKIWQRMRLLDSLAMVSHHGTTNRWCPMATVGHMWCTLRVTSCACAVTELAKAMAIRAAPVVKRFLKFINVSWLWW